MFDDVEGIIRRTMVLFYVIDTSGSMTGERIEAVNTAIKEVIPTIKEISDENADAQIKIAVLEFSTGARWITPNGPMEIDDFQWNDLKPDGVTDLGAACKALNEKLSTKAFMNEPSPSFAPAIFLLSDGLPTDDWQAELSKLKQNNWFKAAVKVAVAIDEDADQDIQDVLAEFTGTKEAVLEAYNPAILKKIIKFVSVRSVQVGARVQATPYGYEGKQAELNDAFLQEFIEETTANQTDW